MLKCLWSEFFFHIFLKYTVWNTRLQSLRCLGLKLTIWQAFKVVLFSSKLWSYAVLFCPQKWFSNCAAKIPRDKSYWRHFGARRWIVRQARDNEADIALLVLPVSKVVKTDRSRRASACISSPKIQLWEANGFNLSADTTLRIRHLRTRRFVLPISKNRVMRKTWPYSVAWRPKVFKWIGAWREMLCQPGSDYILFRQLRRSLAIAGKDKWVFSRLVMH